MLSFCLVSFYSFLSLLFLLFLSVIDFGFAKKVPYTSVDPLTRETKVHAKTFTLCGTPGKRKRKGREGWGEEIGERTERVEKIRGYGEKGLGERAEREGERIGEEIGE